MIVKVVKEFKDKGTKSILKPGILIDVTEDRFSELVAGPVFVEPIDNITIGLDLASGKDMTAINGEVVGSSNEDDGDIDTIAFTKMNKAEMVKYANEVKNIELNMDMTKAEMIELLEE